MKITGVKHIAIGDNLYYITNEGLIAGEKGVKIYDFTKKDFFYANSGQVYIGHNEDKTTGQSHLFNVFENKINNLSLYAIYAFQIDSNELILTDRKNGIQSVTYINNKKNVWTKNNAGILSYDKEITCYCEDELFGIRYNVIDNNTGLELCEVSADKDWRLTNQVRQIDNILIIPSKSKKSTATGYASKLSAYDIRTGEPKWVVEGAYGSFDHYKDKIYSFDGNIARNFLHEIDIQTGEYKSYSFDQHFEMVSFLNTTIHNGYLWFVDNGGKSALGAINLETKKMEVFLMDDLKGADVFTGKPLIFKDKIYLHGMNEEVNVFEIKDLLNR